MYHFIVESNYFLTDVNNGDKLLKTLKGIAKQKY